MITRVIGLIVSLGGGYIFWQGLVGGEVTAFTAGLVLIAFGIYLISQSLDTSTEISVKISNDAPYVTTLAIEIWWSIIRGARILWTLGLPLFIVFLFISGWVMLRPSTGTFMMALERWIGVVMWAGLVGVLLCFYLGLQPVINSLRVRAMGEDNTGDDALFALGARPALAQTDELEILSNALNEITPKAPNVKAPTRWMLINAPHINSFTVGTTIVLTTAALKSQYLIPLMAHELGHLQNEDGITLLALRRLVMNTAYTMGIDRQLEPIGSITGGQGGGLVSSDDAQLYYRVQAYRIRDQMAKEFGGIGLLTTWPSWADYWRERDFLADNFVAEIGLGEELCELLQKHELLDVAQPYYLSGRPYVADRIANIRRQMHKPPVQTATSGPFVIQNEGDQYE